MLGHQRLNVASCSSILKENIKNGYLNRLTRKILLLSTTESWILPFENQDTIRSTPNKLGHFQSVTDKI